MPEINSENLNSLEMTYKQLYELSLQIAELIDRELYTDLISYIERKDRLLNESDAILKKVIGQGENADFLQELCSKIEKQELANISALTKVREEIKEELQKTTSDQKLVNAYTTITSNEGRIVDFRE